MDFFSIETSAIILFFISFYGLITCKSILKSIIAIGIMETAIVVFFLGMVYSEGLKPPIGEHLVSVTDPLPQALMITAIIIGVAVTAINLTMFISLCRQYRAADWDSVKKNRME